MLIERIQAVFVPLPYIWHSLLLMICHRKLLVYFDERPDACRQATVLLSSLCLITHASLHEEARSPNPWAPRLHVMARSRIDRSSRIMRAISLKAGELASTCGEVDESASHGRFCSTEEEKRSASHRILYWAKF